MRKKLSCKKRKLKYIREKNGLKVGHKVSSIFKVRSQFVQTPEGKEYIYRQTLIAKERLEKNYKLRLDGYIVLGYDGNDFIENLTSCLVSLFHKPIWDQKQLIKN
jgi:hypothetical protein